MSLHNKSSHPVDVISINDKKHQKHFVDQTYWEMKKEQEKELMVSVVVCTYNQEQWIGKTLDCILAQETEYPYEIVIGEDKGTDGTLTICKNYADRVNSEERSVKIRVLDRPKNLGLAGNFADCVQQSKGKYVMICDGDDYWQNPNKMQMQVDFMEAHPECVACHTGSDTLHENTGKIIPYSAGRKGYVPEGMIQKEIIEGKENVVCSTLCLRRETLLMYLPFEKFASFPCDDWPMLVIISAYGEIRYLPVSTTTYRVGQTSLTNQKNYDSIRRFWEKSKAMTAYMYELFPSLGEFKDGPYFDTYVYHPLLMAAYINNDYSSAHEFAKKDPKKRISTLCAKMWFTFKIYRMYIRLMK